MDLILSIEHLDYAREAHVRPGIDTLPPSRRALHCVSRLLSNMPTIVNPSVGRATAVAFCDELSVCIRGLRTEVIATANGGVSIHVIILELLPHSLAFPFCIFCRGVRLLTILFMR